MNVDVILVLAPVLNIICIYVDHRTTDKRRSQIISVFNSNSLTSRLKNDVKLCRLPITCEDLKWAE